MLLHANLTRMHPVKTLTAFYIGKLEDTETIVPALKGLLPLSRLSPFTSSEAVDVVNAYVYHLACGWRDVCALSIRYILLIVRTIDCSHM
jgi:hypothetical protein